MAQEELKCTGSKGAAVASGRTLGSGLPREGVVIHASVWSMFRYLLPSNAASFENIQMTLQMSMLYSLGQFVVTGCLLCLHRMITGTGYFQLLWGFHCHAK